MKVCHFMSTSQVYTFNFYRIRFSIFNKEHLKLSKTAIWKYSKTYRVEVDFYTIINLPFFSSPPWTIELFTLAILRCMPSWNLKVIRTKKLKVNHNVYFGDYDIIIALKNQKTVRIMKFHNLICLTPEILKIYMDVYHTSYSLC